MKKLIFLGIGSALVFTMSGVGSAQADTIGTIHKSTAALAGTNGNLVGVAGARCAGCHRTHTAKAEKLLKQAEPALCYTCHGSLGSVLDVVDGIDQNAPAGSQALRGGGFAYALLNGAGAAKNMGALDPVTGRIATTAYETPLAAGTAVTSRHQIDGVTTGTMWGNGAISDTIAGALDAGKGGVTMECTSCHDPHGNGNYRILKPVPNDAATTAVTAKAAVAAAAAIPVIWDDPTTVVNEYRAAVPAVLAAPAVLGVTAVVVAAVNIPDAITKTYTTTNYWAVADRNVPTVKPAVGVSPVEPIAGQTDGYITNVAAWCSTCHTRYLAGSGSYKTPLADASGKVDATFTYRHRSDRIDKDGVGRPNCIQCHVSHGTNVAMSGNSASFTAPNRLVPVGAGGSGDIDAAGNTVPSIAAVGTSRLLRVDNRGTCAMCHNV